MTTPSKPTTVVACSVVLFRFVMNTNLLPKGSVEIVAQPKAEKLHAQRRHVEEKGFGAEAKVGKIYPGRQDTGAPLMDYEPFNTLFGRGAGISMDGFGNAYQAFIDQGFELHHVEHEQWAPSGNGKSRVRLTIALETRRESGEFATPVRVTDEDREDVAKFLEKVAGENTFCFFNHLEGSITFNANGVSLAPTFKRKVSFIPGKPGELLPRVNVPVAAAA